MDENCRALNQTKEQQQIWGEDAQYRINEQESMIGSYNQEITKQATQVEKHVKKNFFWRHLARQKNFTETKNFLWKEKNKNSQKFFFQTKKSHLFFHLHSNTNISLGHTNWRIKKRNHRYESYHWHFNRKISLPIILLIISKLSRNKLNHYINEQRKALSRYSIKTSFWS